MESPETQAEGALLARRSYLARHQHRVRIGTHDVLLRQTTKRITKRDSEGNRQKWRQSIRHGYSAAAFRSSAEQGSVRMQTRIEGRMHENRIMTTNLQCYKPGENLFTS